VERLHKAPNPFLATVGLRVEPAAAGLGSAVPGRGGAGLDALAFLAAVEDTVRETLRQGLYGWEVTDCTVAMTHSGYLAKHGLGHQRFNKSISSTGEDFRKLTPLVLMAALRQAGTVVCEPIHRLRLEVPDDTLGAVLPVLARLDAVPGTPVPRGSSYLLEGEIPAARVHELQQQLSALTRGRGRAGVGLPTATSRGARDRFPTRPRTDHDPGRMEYLRHVLRRARARAGQPVGRLRVAWSSHGRRVAGRDLLQLGRSARHGPAARRVSAGPPRRKRPWDEDPGGSRPAGRPPQGVWPSSKPRHDGGSGGVDWRRDFAPH
jgi:hypothetical protein